VSLKIAIDKRGLKCREVILICGDLLALHGNLRPSGGATGISIGACVSKQNAVPTGRSL
jgi:hypothetical protein